MARAHATLTLLGAENVRSNPATVRDTRRAFAPSSRQAGWCATGARPKGCPVSGDLRRAADALKEAEATWKRVTTLQPLGRAFGAASFELFDTLRMVVAAPVDPDKQLELGLEVDASLRSLERGTRDLARFVERSHDATRACLNSELLFAPARERDHSAEHLQSRARGGYAPIAPDAANHLFESIDRAVSLTAGLSVDMDVVDAARASLAVRR